MSDCKIDLHTHTKYSDGLDKPQKLVEYARKKNLAIAITDHNRAEGNLEVQDNNKNVLVVPGIETTCKEGPHLLFYFYLHW